jgi:hypothetical protein
MDSASILAAGSGPTTVLKLPNVFGSVSVTVKTEDPFRNAVSLYGIGVVLE